MDRSATQVSVEAFGLMLALRLVSREVSPAASATEKDSRIADTVIRRE